MECMAWRWLWHRSRKNLVHYVLIAELFIRLCGSAKLNNSSGCLNAGPEFKGYNEWIRLNFQGRKFNFVLACYFWCPTFQPPLSTVSSVYFQLRPSSLHSPSIYIFPISLPFSLLISETSFFRRVILVLKIQDRFLHFHLTSWSKNLFEKAFRQSRNLPLLWSPKMRYFLYPCLDESSPWPLIPLP